MLISRDVYLLGNVLGGSEQQISFAATINFAFLI
jgi:hypothetical protein